MATATKPADLKTLADVFGVEVEDVDPAAERIQRGRQKSDDVLAIRDVLRKLVEDQSVKAFTINDPNEKSRNNTKTNMVNKIRSAATKGATDGTDLDVATAWVGERNRLYFGWRPAIEAMGAKQRKKGTEAVSASA